MRIETYTIGIELEGANRVAKGLDRIDRKANQISRSSNKAGGGLGGLFGGAKSLIPGLGIAGAVSGIVTAGKDIEKAVVGIGKTTGLAGNELNSLKSSIIDLGKNTSVPISSLLELAQAAGTLGIKGEDNIIKFTDTLGKLELATADFRGEEAASSLKAILDLTGEGVEDVDKLASALVSLGNNTNNTEGQVARLATEVAKGVAVFNTSSESVLGLSSTLAALKQQPELARSTVNRTLTEIQLAFVEGGKEAKKFASIAGVSLKDFKNLFDKDAIKALTAFTDGLGKQADEGISVAQNLDELGLKGASYANILGVLSSQSELLVQSQRLVSDEYKNATALQNEAAAAADSLDAKIRTLKNRFTALSDNIYQILAPALKSIVSIITVVVDAFDRVITKIRQYFSENKKGFESDGLKKLNDNLKEQEALREKINQGISPDRNLRTLEKKQEQELNIKRRFDVGSNVTNSNTSTSFNIDRINIESNASSFSNVIDDIQSGIIAGQSLPSGVS